MAKVLLKIASGIDLGIGGFILLISLLVFGIGLTEVGFIGFGIAAILLSIGGVFLHVARKDEEGFIKSRNVVLALSIVSIFMGNVINFVLGLIAYADMQTKASSMQPKIKRELTEEEKAQKRLRNLLALGCALVLLSGIIFAMTTWETLSGFAKTTSLIVATLVFALMSNLAEKKFKLKNSAITYYVLANAFVIFAIISAGYFELFGAWFSLNGKGAELYTGIVWLLVALLSYMAYAKYDMKNIFYIIGFALLLSLVYVLTFFNISLDIRLFVVLTILAILSLMPQKGEIINKINSVAKVFFAITSVVLLLNIVSLVGSQNKVIFSILAFGVAFVSMYYLSYSGKEAFYEFFTPLYTVVTAFLLTTSLNLNINIMFLQFILITVIVYVMGYLKSENKKLFISSSIIADIALLYVLVDAVRLGYNYYALLSGVLLLCTSLVTSIDKKLAEFRFEKVLEPVKVISLSYALYSFVGSMLNYEEDVMFLALVGFVLTIVGVFRGGLLRKIYSIVGIVAVFFSMTSTISQFSPISQSLCVISLTVLLFISLKAKDIYLEKYKELIYGLNLLALASLLLNTFIHFDLELVGIILLTVVYSILFITSNKNDIFRCFTIVALLVPYLAILPISVWNDNVNYILYSLPCLALIFVYTRGFLASVNLKTVNLIEVIALSIWYLVVSSQIALEVAIFIGIISFMSILAGYKNEKWISLYYTGVVFLIINTVFQLKDFWTSIPIWAYLLIAGLILIGIVTYKEYSKINKENDVEKVEAKIVEDKNQEVLKTPIDKRSVVAGSLLYLIIFVPAILEKIL